MDQSVRDNLKQQRLNDYEAQMYLLEMDIVALEAVGDTVRVSESRNLLEQMKRAYRAVEELA